jgi:pilus assembly protein CpaE
MGELEGIISKLSVIISLPDVEESRKIQEILSREKDLITEEMITDGFILTDKVKTASPDIIILDYHLKNINVVEFVEEATIRYPTTAIIMIINEDDLIDIRKILNKRTRNIVSRPYNPEDFPKIIRNAFISTIKSRKLLSSDLKEKKPGVLISICSAKGGVGKSVLSANLSLILSNLKEKYKVILLDLNIPYGDQKAMTGINPEKEQSIIDLLRVADELTTSRINSIVAKSENYPNIDIVLSPNKANSENDIDTGQLLRMLKSLKLVYDFVIADINPGLDSLNRVILEESDRIMVLFTPEVSTIYRLVNFLRDFQSLRLTRPPDIIYNRRNKRNDQVISNILAKVLPYPIYASITEDSKAVINSLNSLYPVVTRKGPVRKDIMQIAQALLEWYNET